MSWCLEWRGSCRNGIACLPDLGNSEKIAAVPSQHAKRECLHNVTPSYHQPGTSLIPSTLICDLVYGLFCVWKEASYLINEASASKVGLAPTASYDSLSTIKTIHVCATTRRLRDPHHYSSDPKFPLQAHSLRLGHPGKDSPDAYLYTTYIYLPK